MVKNFFVVFLICCFIRQGGNFLITSFTTSWHEIIFSLLSFLFHSASTYLLICTFDKYSVLGTCLESHRCFTGLKAQGSTLLCEDGLCEESLYSGLKIVTGVYV